MEFFLLMGFALMLAWSNIRDSGRYMTVSLYQLTRRTNVPAQ